MKTISEVQLDKPVQSWNGRHRGVAFQVKRREPFDEPLLKRMFPSGQWTYYVYIQESASPRFKELWLEDMETKHFGPERIDHDYYAEPLGSIEMHGGITWYEKHGHTEGHRCVEIGCDFQHAADEGHHYNVQSVAREAMATIDDLIEKGLVLEEKEETKK